MLLANKTNDFKQDHLSFKAFKKDHKTVHKHLFFGKSPSLVNCYDIISIKYMLNKILDSYEKNGNGISALVFGLETLD